MRETLGTPIKCGADTSVRAKTQPADVPIARLDFFRRSLAFLAARAGGPLACGFTSRPSARSRSRQPFARSAAIRARLCVSLHAQFPGGAHGSAQHLFARGGKPNMRHTHASPAAVDGQENFRQLFHESSLLFDCQFQIPVTLLCRGERSEDSAADAEVGVAHVRTLFRAREAERDSTEIVYVHDDPTALSRVSRAVKVTRQDLIANCLTAAR